MIRIQFMLFTEIEDQTILARKIAQIRSCTTGATHGLYHTYKNSCNFKGLFFGGGGGYGPLQSIISTCIYVFK